MTQPIKWAAEFFVVEDVFAQPYMIGEVDKEAKHPQSCGH